MSIQNRKIFNLIKNRKPWPPISIPNLFQQGLLVHGHTFYTPEVFWLRFHFFLEFAICTI